MSLSRQVARESRGCISVEMVGLIRVNVPDLFGGGAVGEKARGQTFRTKVCISRYFDFFLVCSFNRQGLVSKIFVNCFLPVTNKSWLRVPLQQ